MALSRLFFGLPRRAEPVPPEPLQIEIDGRPVFVHLKPMARARRMVMRLARDGGSFTMSVPLRQSRKRAEDFALLSKDWMRKALAKSAPAVAFADGAILPLRGADVVVRSTGRARGAIRLEEAGRILHVPGAPEHVARRLTEWLKQEARRDFEQASRRYAAAMQARFTRLAVRDQKSRWGSCSTDGTLSYSWRLILAPPYVLDYVAAHEVAHLLEMNHSQRFWRLVLSHCAEARAAKQWLKKHGHTLHRYG